MRHPFSHIIRKMRNHGVSLHEIINERDNSLLHIAIEHGLEDIALELIDSEIDIHHRNEAGLIPLHVAIRRNKPHIVRRLLEKKADANASYLLDERPLYLALLNDSTYVIANSLIEHGANINYQDSDGGTLLHRFHNSSISEFLIKSGINVNLCDKRGYPALWDVSHLLIYRLIKADNITFEHLRQQVQNGSEKGKSIFCKFIELERLHYGNVDWLWDKFEKDFTYQDIFFKPENGPSIFYTLSQKRTAFNFNKLWQKFKNEITIENLRASYLDVNALSYLFSLENNLDSHSDFDFLEIWHIFKYQLTMEDFCPRHFPYFLSAPKLSSILPELLTQIPGKLYSYPPLNVRTIKDVKRLISAKNDFFEAFEVAQKESEVKKVDLSELFSLAEEAQKEGYANAYYNLGVWLKEISFEDTSVAFAKVPPTSWYFEKTQQELAEHYLEKAKLATTELEKNDNLQKSLTCILNAKKECHLAHIKKLAVLALSSQEEVLEEKDLPLYLLEFIEQQLSADTWLALFNQVKEERNQLKNQNQQQKELLDQLQAVEQELRELREVTKYLSEKIEEEEIPFAKPLVFSSSRDMPSTTPSLAVASEKLPTLTR